jgi:dTDP-4-amino-4,6-dideoxygalactose transaminase
MKGDTMTKAQISQWPKYEDEQIAEVVAVLQSGKVSQWTGPHVGQFERGYADYLGRKHAVALANGTLALELPLRILGIGQGDEVIVTSRSFLASAGCVSFVGAVPVFADVDLDSQNVTVATIAPLITSRTKAIIVVHLAGWPCDMNAVMALAEKHGLFVIEDCAQAHGATYNGRPVGSFGHFAAFSFCQDKIITTGGEGGLLALDDDEMWKRCWSFKDHGKNYDTVFNREHPPGFRWLHESIGTNWRMTSIQAVMGLYQLRKLGDYRLSRKRNAKILLDTFVNLKGLRVPVPTDDIEHAFYRFYSFVRPERLQESWSRDRIIAALTEKGVSCFVGSCSEIYRERVFQGLGLGPPQRLPNAVQLGETSVAFLVDPCQTPETMQAVASSVAEIMLQSTKPQYA